MGVDRIRGLASNIAMFDSLADGAKVEAGRMLADIGGYYLKEQQASAPVDTGNLKSRLNIQLMIDRLRVRVGIFTSGRGRSNAFYGRFVEFGRQAQWVIVQRRRRVGGRLRTGRVRKLAADIATTYPLYVRARAPHPFIFGDRPGADNLAARRIDQFWTDLLSKAGGE